ncbi:MAG: nicotinate-nucleotide adenylyltransferase [Acidobacteriota bacterium]|nr:nicotinate-nucleotide adenylyltransferase [Acidobacteriota bacterium]
MSRSKRVALYGGTFDPVHDGHLTVARGLLDLLALDEVLFVPAHVAPHKRGKPPTSPWLRHAMLALATGGEPRMLVSSAELDAPERPYSVETVARFKEELGAGARLFFVMGADSWGEITTWRDWERLLSMCDHVVVTRPGYELSFEHVPANIRARLVDLRGAVRDRTRRAVEESGPPKIFLSDAASVDVSSTSVRRAAARGGVESLPVPRAVADYIGKYGLYRDNA